MPKNEELIGDYVFEKIRFENVGGDCLISDVINKTGAAVATKGPEPKDGFIAGRTYRFYGHWTTYKNKYRNRTEDQFQYSSVDETEPITETGAKVYLQRVKGIGQAAASRLWDAYGAAVFEVLREGEIEKIHETTKISIDVLEVARAMFIEGRNRELSTIELLGLLDGKGFPKSTVESARSRWGINAAAMIRKNPYILMELSGVGFKRCDQLYLSMKLPPSSIRRQAYCAAYGVDSECSSSGSTWVLDKHARAAVKGLIAGAEVRPERALRTAIRAGLIQSKWTNGNGELHWDGDDRHLADRGRAYREQRLAKMIRAAMNDTFSTKVHIGPELSKHQLEKLKLLKGDSCLRILGGGGGTGKTFVLARLVKAWLEVISAGKIALAAPTGKAAVRITESLASAGIKLQATTWHKLLGYFAGGWTYGEDNPLPYQIVIGDEASMVDTDMGYRAFAARGPGCLYFLVGDVNQLPPVSHGAPLRDVIAAGIPYAELEEVQRNAGEIVLQGKNIRENARIKLHSGADAAGKNLELVTAADTSEQISAMLAILAGMEDPVGSCQVLTPTNKSGDLGRKNLNQILQNELNPNPTIAGSPFRLGDKVVNTKNGWLKCLEASDDAIVHEKGQVYVANGEVGTIIECEQSRLDIKLDSPSRIVQVYRSKQKAYDGADDDDAVVKPEDQVDTGCKWDLAYALSVHKFQGSETPVAIVMLDARARRLCSREWLYTAISRAKQKCYLVGSKSVAERMVEVSKIGERKTFLKELIQNAT